MATAENPTSGKAAFDHDMDRCNFWHANRYWIALTWDTVIFGHYASERSGGALVFSGGRRVT